MTREELNEYMKCAGDVEYFAEKYVKTWHPVNGLQNISLNEFQKNAIKDFKEKKFFSKTVNRQEGKTLLGTLLFLHESLFNDYKVNVAMAPKLDYGNNIIERIREMYENLPDFLKITKMIKENKSTLKFENGSMVKSIGNSSYAMRGLSISNLYFDESDFIPNLEEIVNSYYPCIVSRTGRMFAFTSSATTEAFRESRISA